MQPTPDLPSPTPKILVLHSGQGEIRGADLVVLTILDLMQNDFALRLVTDHEELARAARARGHTADHWTFPGAWSLRLTWPRLRTTVVAGLRLWRLIRRERIDLVHVNNGHYAHLMVLPALLMGVPWLVHLHAPLSRRTQVLFGIPCADRILAVANLVHAAWKGVPRLLRKCRTVHNTVRVVTVPPPLPRDTFGIPADRFVIVVAAVLTPAKAVDVAIAAVKELLRRDRPVHLLVVGDGPERDRLVAMAEGLPVTFAGYRQDVLAIFAGCADAMVLPSRAAEGMPLVLLEAAQAGVPRIGSTDAGISEVITDEEDGLLFPIDNATALAERIERLMDDSALARRLTENAKARLTRDFSPEVFRRSLAANWRELLSSPPGLLARLHDILLLAASLFATKIALYAKKEQKNNL